MEFKAHAYKTRNNSHPIEIMINERLEEVTYKYSGVSEMYTTSINYDMEGEAYFNEYKGPYQPTVHYLNEFMKVNFI